LVKRVVSSPPPLSSIRMELDKLWWTEEELCRSAESHARKAIPRRQMAILDRRGKHESKSFVWLVHSRSFD